MTGFSFKRITTMIVILLLGLAPKAFSLEDVTKGSILKGIDLNQNQQGDYLLVIEGSLNGDALDTVRVKQKIKENKMLISLPSSLVDPDGISNPFLTFGEAAPIENIKITEEIQELEDKTEDYVVVLEVLTKGPLRAQVMRPVSNERLVVKIVNLDKEEDKAELPETLGTKAIKEARAKQQEFSAKRQRELEEQKRTARDQAQKDVQVILKSYNKPLVMRVAVINGSGVPKSAYQLSVYLGSVKKKDIEKDLGLKLDIANIANAKIKNVQETTIYYKENYLKPALHLAELIQGYQRVVPMRGQKEKIGVDVEIYLGNDYR